MSFLRLSITALFLLATAATADPIRVVSLPTNDLAYDPVTRQIYASVPSVAGSRGNSITVIDPETGQVGPSVFVGSEPGKLAIGDKGLYLYVSLDGAAAVRRFDTVTQTAGTQFSLGSNYGPNFVEDMAVLPGHPESVAISKYNKGISPRHVHVAIYDNGVQRPKVAAGANVIAFGATAARLYGYHNETTDFAFVRWNVDETGILGGDSLSLLSGFGQDILFDGGRIYGTSGGVYDPEAGTLVGSLPGGVIRPDSALGRVFILQGENADVQLLAYDPNTFLKLWSVKIPGVSGGVGSLIRWGSDGVAFRSSGGQVFLVHTAALSAPPALPVLLSLTLDPTRAKGEMTVTGTVTLSSPAPAEGVTVQLSSANPQKASVPPPVTVPAGARTASFPVMAHGSPSTVDIPITASFAGVTRTALLQVGPGDPVLAAPVYNPANGHWYQEAQVPGTISWSDAKTEAEALTYAGSRGHLATITSADENQFILTHVPHAADTGAHWLGGYRTGGYPLPTLGWVWVTGEPWSYANWHGDNPYKVNLGNTLLAWYPDGTWITASATSGLIGFMIEYDTPAPSAPNPPPAPSSTQLVLFPNPVLGGLLALGEVTLAQPAGPGGVLVTLASSSPTVALAPTAVTVLPGATTVTFPIITFPVASPTPVTITAGGPGGSASAVLQVLPLGASPPVVTSTADLLAPTGLDAHLLIGQGIELTWKDNSSDENAFAIWRRTPPGDWVRVGVVPPNTTRFLDRSVTPGGSYNYRVRATRGNVASEWSNEVGIGIGAVGAP